VRVVLPSEEVLPVPEGVGTVPDLKSHIEKEIGIPGAVQRLFTGRGELSDTQPLAALPRNVDIDLVIAAGRSYFICRAGLRDRLDSVSGEIFVTHASRLAARDEANLTDDPQANLAAARNEPTPQQEESQPFLEAFARNRKARLGH